MRGALGVADGDGQGTFALRSRPDWASYELNVPGAGAFDVEELPVARVATLVTRFGHHHIDLLKLDIEGAEYGVINGLLSSNIDVRQILVEFHYERHDLGRLQAALIDLRRAGYLMFARSPAGSEFSFWRA